MAHGDGGPMRRGHTDRSGGMNAGVHRRGRGALIRTLGRGVRRGLEAALVVALGLGGRAAESAEWPKMRLGEWVFTRTAPVDPIYDLARPVSVTNEYCVEQPGDFFVDPNNRLLDLCNFSRLQRKGDTYTASSSCSIPMWRAKLHTRRVTRVNGDVGYHTSFQTDGTVNGKHVHWTETIIAKRLGECPESNQDEDSDKGGPGAGGAGY